MELNNKIISFLGDSITEGSGVVDKENNRYDMRLKKMYNLKEVYNYGIGGTRIAPQIIFGEAGPVDLGDFCKRSKEMNKKEATPELTGLDQSIDLPSFLRRR